MATVLDVVTGALQLLEVQTAESPVEPVESADGLISLNDMMNEWNVDGIDVGYPREGLTSTTDILRVRIGSIGAIKANLAIYFAPEYGRIVTPVLQQRADKGKTALRSSLAIKSLAFPDTLPIGSGNEDNNDSADGDVPGGFNSRRFYPSNANRDCF